MKAFVDYYKTLNLPFGSSEEVIRKYFRELAKVYHPDNLKTGSENRFKEILDAYKTLTGTTRERYDKEYQKNLQIEINKSKVILEYTLPPDRIIYTTSISFLAKHGLMRVGYRRKDRKILGMNHDIDLLIKKEETNKRIFVRIPLIVRILCPECGGSNIYCECCNGIGTYKGTRILTIAFEPFLLVNNRIYEFDLKHLRPDKFIHFKKKKIKIKIDIN